MSGYDFSKVFAHVIKVEKENQALAPLREAQQRRLIEDISKTPIAEFMTFLSAEHFHMSGEFKEEDKNTVECQLFIYNTQGNTLHNVICCFRRSLDKPDIEMTVIGKSISSYKLFKNITGNASAMEQALCYFAEKLMKVNRDGFYEAERRFRNGEAPVRSLPLSNEPALIEHDSTPTPHP